MKGVGTPAADLQMMAQRRALDRLWMALSWICAWLMSRHTPVAISSMLSVMSCLASPTGQLMLDVGNQRRGILAEVVTRRVHHLQLQFDTEGKGSER
ncbi:Uncharacterised protein [Klebsiella pneumoniae]|nr:Uncharacterised protein [Klebsiella pneumoniae]